MLNWAARIQQYFGILMEQFNRMGLRKNVAKMVRMACHPCRTLGGHLEEAYGLRVMGEGNTYWERLRQRVRCPK